MLKVDDLLKDNIINKCDLILKRSVYLGLEKQEAKLIAKIFFKNNTSYLFNLSEISIILNLEESTVKIILQNLITKGYISITFKNGIAIFDFELFIKKLLYTYFPPSDNASLTQKLIWIQSKLNFKLTEYNKTKIHEFVENNSWIDIVLLVSNKKFSKISNWEILLSFISVFKNDRNNKNENIKKLLEKNWLE